MNNQIHRFTWHALSKNQISSFLNLYFQHSAIYQAHGQTYWSRHYTVQLFQFLLSIFSPFVEAAIKSSTFAVKQSQPYQLLLLASFQSSKVYNREFYIHLQIEFCASFRNQLLRFHPNKHQKASSRSFLFILAS